MTNASLENEKDTPLIAWLALIFLAVVWGLSFVLIKKIVVSFTAIELGAGRIFVASLALLPWAIKYFKKYPKDKTFMFFISGITGYLAPAFIFGIVGSKLNSSLAGTLNATTPLFVLVIGALFFAQKIKKFQLIGIAIAFIGSLLLILSGGDNKLDFSNPYALLIMLATIMYGFNANILGTYLKGIKPMIISAYSLLFVGIIAFVFLLFTDFFSKIFLPENHHLLIYFILLGAINSGLAAVLFNYVLQISSPVFATSVTYLIPIVATIAGFFDGELIALWHYVGMAIILGGIYLINKK